MSRISRRVLAEHHISLTKDLQAKRDGDTTHQDHVGIIYTALKVKDSIDFCANFLRNRPFSVDNDGNRGANTTADWSEVIVDGQIDTKFAYIKEHLESVESIMTHCRINEQLCVSYIIFELLKNVRNSISYLTKS